MVQEASSFLCNNIIHTHNNNEQENKTHKHLNSYEKFYSTHVRDCSNHYRKKCDDK
jgi:hypothetical protein